MRPVNRLLILSIALASGWLANPRVADATIVKFETVMGDFEVNLYDNATPATVANFLNYVQNGAYSDSIIHRSEPGFVIQGGGIAFDGIATLTEITTNPAVANEPEFSNVRGTIAMAKLGGQPDSATSQFFFNLVNNATGLDDNNGGFTVFGQVIGDGMDVVDAIAALPRFNFGAPINTLPLINYVADDPLDDTNLVIVNTVMVSNTEVDTAAGLTRPANTLVNSNNGGGNAGGGGGGGGSFGLFSLFGLLLVQARRRATR